MILSMGAGQLDLWSKVSHSMVITLLPSCFMDDIKIENFVFENKGVWEFIFNLYVTT